ncbi:alpha/beta fold hydrolase [Streptomyces sp. NPDC058371]|uniref:alpha/beta fold hydrolase n=1 Tax=Streptomyces sp. NPDC058371 TaxID=3346463 RepID=UPI0036562DEF
MSETDPRTALHYEVCGSGPVLLVVPGGAGHPMGLGGLTERLADRFTVVTYDPLGLAHGRLGSPVEDQRVRSWSEGAHRVLHEVLPGGEGAYVFGTSSGAIAALDLLTRYPQRLRRVVAHEPPSVAVLPDAARHRAMFTEVYDAYRAAGPDAAGARLTAGLMESEGASEERHGGVGAHPPSPEDELSSPMALFLTRVLRQFTAYAPDLVALKGLAPRLVLAAGTDSRGQLLYRTAALTAELTGAGFAEFPGGHVGVVQYPGEFAERLVGALTQSPPQAYR